MTSRSMCCQQSQYFILASLEKVLFGNSDENSTFGSTPKMENKSI